MKLKVIAESGNFFTQRTTVNLKKIFNLETSTFCLHHQKNNKTMFPPKTNLFLKVTKSYMFRLTKLTIVRLNMKKMKNRFEIVSIRVLCFV